MNADEESLVARQIQLAMIEISLGVNPVKSVHGLCTVWKEAGQRGAMTLKELTDLLSQLNRWSDDQADGWAKGYAEGWATAILRVLEERDVPVADEGHWYITTRTDLKTLAQWLDMSLFVADWRELVRAERAGSASPGSSET
ncbi:hypothetical protein ABZ464_14945 [Streptomyces sp. NPDC005820]|uniref:hypothetical protein n=1 Tax=Streptomyces sp. NPDC005820 TaxID=3157069 RepID=UPI0033D77468